MISTCILTRNDAPMIERVIASVRPYVQEVIVIDDKSTDNTSEKATAAGALVKQLQTDIQSNGFAAAANEMMAYASQEFVFILDSDELVADAHLLQTLVRYPDKNAWALPRRKWHAYPKVREEYEAYPDWQTRFFKKEGASFVGEMHVRFVGHSVHRAYSGPIIEHLQYECRTPEKNAHRKQLYKHLADLQGVHIVGGGRKEAR